MRINIDPYGFMDLPDAMTVIETDIVRIQVGSDYEDYIDIQMPNQHEQAILICTGRNRLKILPEVANTVSIKVD